MHMISRKDLSNAEMDTFTKSCSLTIVITALEMCKRMKRHLCMSKSWIYSWLWKSSRTRQHYCRLESFSMKTGIPTNGSMVKNHISLKTGFGNFVIRKTSFLSWFQACQVLPLHLHQLYGQTMKQESHSSSSSSSSPSSSTVGEISGREREDAPNSDISPVPVSELVDDRAGKLEETQANKIPKTKSKRDRDRTGKTCVVILRSSNGFKNSGKMWVDDEIPLQGGSHASSSHEASLEPTTKRREDLGKHLFVFISLKTEIAKSVNGPKLQGLDADGRDGEAVPRAANFGDLITADYKVLSDNCESRNNYRYAVVVQDLATQWIQAYPCKNKTSQGTQRSLQKFLEPERKLKVIYTDNSLGIRQSLWRSLLASLHVYTTPIGD